MENQTKTFRDLDKDKTKKNTNEMKPVLLYGSETSSKKKCAKYKC